MLIEFLKTLFGPKYIRNTLFFFTASILLSLFPYIFLFDKISFNASEFMTEWVKSILGLTVFYLISLFSSFYYLSSKEKIDSRIKAEKINFILTGLNTSLIKKDQNSKDSYIKALEYYSESFIMENNPNLMADYFILREKMKELNLSLAISQEEITDLSSIINSIKVKFQ